MLKHEISPATGKPVSRLCLNLGSEMVALFKAVADVKNLSVEEVFRQCVRPYVLALVEELSMRQDADVEILETIEESVMQMFVGSVKKRVAA